MTDKEPTNKEIVEQLQKLGVEDINPNATKAQLQAMLDKAQPNIGGSSLTTSNAAIISVDMGEVRNFEVKSDTDKILEAVMGLGKSVASIDQRLTKIEDGGKNDFKMSIKQDDVDKATEAKKNMNPKVVEIVEDVLGIDFGIELIPNPDNPGFNLTLLVPQRLSPIPMSMRPIVDKETGGYMRNPKTQEVVEEQYWPGDKRTRAIGSTDSFDLIRDHCTKVRAHIVTYYEKMKKPLPEFKLK